MLQSIHDNAKGWVAYLILIFISVPFALWGIQEYLGGSGKSIVAVVNGQDIELQAVQNEVAQQRQRLISMFGETPPGLDEKNLKRSALDSLINQTLLNQYASEQGYRASSEEVVDLIKGIPQFSKEGQFDAELYRQMLALQGRSEASFELQLRLSLTNDQFRNAVMDTAFLPKSEMQRYQSLSTQKRDIEVYTLRVADVIKDIEISADSIDSEYKEHPERYQTDERVKIAYVELKMSDISQSVEVTDDILLEHYEDNKVPYSEEAKFKMSHIKVSMTDQQDAEQARIKAEALYAQISSGAKSFEAIASSTDDDTLFSELGESIGYLKKGSVDPAIEEIVFNAEIGGINKPIKTATGYEIIKVLERVEEQQQSFTQAKAEVEKDYRRMKSIKRYDDMQDLLKNTSYENDGSLQPAASALGVEIKNSEFFSRTDRKGGTALVSNPKVVKAAFSRQVLSEGINSEFIELSGSHAIVLRVSETIKPQLKPLADVSEVIMERLKQEQGSQKVKEKGDEMLATVIKAGNWGSLSLPEGVDGESMIKKYPGISREDNTLPRHVVSKAFQVLHTDSGSEPVKATFSGVEGVQGDYSIIALTAVKEGDVDIDTEAMSQYSAYIGNREQRATLKALKEQADIEIYQQKLEDE